MPEIDGALIREFLDALNQARDAAEFEHLMGDGRKPDPWERLRDTDDALHVHFGFHLYDDDEPSALDALKGRMALERLQQGHPELWEQTMTGAVDAG